MALPVSRLDTPAAGVLDLSMDEQFTFALTFNSRTEYMPLPIGLYAFFGKQDVLWNELMATAFLGIAPAMIIILFLQRYLVGGLTAGAVKNTLHNREYVTCPTSFGTA
ncbi:hypothetical protein [Rhodobacter sp. 24-YEA-8]|uniref:hypothetical protein n=1 Tax=Rhodobacter sp. 24-YEA-8 TaxID=1884310 RepID=UPI00209B2548|nr:hypothetical protein [Rhodobacter sp. 24-YEA-8]